MRYQNDVIRSVLLHTRANLDMMLARDYALCHAARRTKVMLVAKKENSDGLHKFWIKTLTTICWPY